MKLSIARPLSLLVFVACASAAPPVAVPGTAQTVVVSPPVVVANDEAPAVLAVVQRLYDGMRARDTLLMRSALHTDARFFVSSTTNRQPLTRLVPLDVYLGSISGSGERLDPQPVAPIEIRVRGNIATAWVPFTLRRNGNLSHCGLDSFQLALTPIGWRIIQLFEMQQREGC
jgi:hypothetical protein